MSDLLQKAVDGLNEKLAENAFDGSAKFVIGDEGSVVINGASATVSDDDADVTMTADVDTFTSIMEGDMNPTSAFMTGKLTIDGDMGKAMALASVLA